MTTWKRIKQEGKATELLGAQYKVEWEPKELDELSEIAGLSGRDIKSMLKLATLVAAKGTQKVTVDAIRQVAVFQDTVKEMDAEAKEMATNLKEGKS